MRDSWRWALVGDGDDGDVVCGPKRERNREQREIRSRDGDDNAARDREMELSGVMFRGSANREERESEEEGVYVGVTCQAREGGGW